MSLSASTLSSQVQELDLSRGSERTYRPDVDGLRAVAILSVLVFHADPRLLPGGFAGVDVFFVISGFLITGIILRQLDGGRFNFLEFYSRRARRLFPAILVVFVAVLSAGWLLLLSDEFMQLGKHMTAGALFSLNLLLFHDSDAYAAFEGQQLIHLWSLGVEEQFYLLWPLLLVTAWVFMRRAVVLILVVLTAGSFAANVAQIPWNPLASFYLPWNRLWELSLGGLIAYFHTVRRSGRIQQSLPDTTAAALRRSYNHALGVGGVTLLAISFSQLHSTWEHPGLQGLVPVSGTMLLVAAGPDSWINRVVLTNRAMVFVGLISYPLYLWHWPLLAFGRIVVGNKGWAAATALAAAFILASMTYKFVELPIRRKPRKIQVPLALAGGVIACACLGYLASNQTIPARSHPPEVIRFEHARENWQTGAPGPWDNLEPSFFELGNGKRQVLYIGDSFMQHYYLRVDEVLRQHPLNAHGAVFAVRAACAPLVAIERELIFGRQSCVEHSRRALEYAKRPTVDAVVISSSWDGTFANFDGERFVLDANADRILAPMRRAIAELSDMGKETYIVLVSPVHRNFSPRSRILRRIASPFEVEIRPDPSRAEVLLALAAVNEELTQIALDTGAKIIDPTRELCGRETCPSLSSNGEPIYRDEAHIRPSYAKANLSYLDETILRGVAVPD